MKLIPVILIVLLTGCISQVEELPSSEIRCNYPKIASWLSKKDQLLAGGKPYDLIMTGWVTPEEADAFKKQNPDVLILAGVTVSWVYEGKEWKQFLETIASGDGTSRAITENMFLRRPDGSKCGFGWASQEWGHEEIYAMDPQNQEWRQLVVTAYKVILEQPQHDGVIVDMLIGVSWCPDAITDEEWVSGVKGILKEIKSMADAHNKVVLFNAGRQFSDIEMYAAYTDGYVMENFLGLWGADYDTGLRAADSPYLVVYAVDTDDTGIEDLKRMRLGLTLSLLCDNTYFTYDFGPRDHGQAWWFPEYDVNLGEPVGEYYKKDTAYWRDFEKGTVISCPYADCTVTFDDLHIDVTTGITSHSFVVEKGDGRIFVRAEAENPELLCFSEKIYLM